MAGADRESFTVSTTQGLDHTSSVGKQNSDEQTAKPIAVETSKGDSATASASKNLSAQERIGEDFSAV